MTSDQLKSYGLTGLVCLAICMTVVLGVEAFTASGVPSTPTTSLVFAEPYGAAPSITLTSETRAYGNQPLNGIDQIPPKLVYSAWINGKIIAENLTSSLGPIGGHHNDYRLVATITLFIPGDLPQPIHLRLETQVVVSTWFDVYLSPKATQNFTVVPGSGTGQVPSPAHPSAGQFDWNFYGALTGAITFDLGLMVLALWAFDRPLLIRVQQPWRLGYRTIYSRPGLLMMSLVGFLVFVILLIVEASVYLHP